MTVDLTGGLPDERKFVFAAQPDDPEMRESVNAWIWAAGPRSACRVSRSRRSRISGTRTTSK